MKKFIVALALLLGVLAILARFAELNKVLDVLRRGNLGYLSLALLAQAAWIYNLGSFYQATYRALGMPVKHAHITRLASAGFFMTIAAPSAGLSAMAIFYDDARRRGLPVARVTVAAILYVWFEYIGTLGTVLFGIAELAFKKDLHWTEFLSMLALLGGAAGIALLLYLGMHSSAALGKMLAYLTRLANTLLRPFIRRDCLREERAYAFSNELAEGVRFLRCNLRRLAWPFYYTILNKALLVVVLGFCFLAFRVQVSLGSLIAGQSFAHMFMIVAPTPAGIGFMEGIMALVLNSLGIPLGDAAVVTLAYRAYSFWVPFFFGMAMFNALQAGERPGPAVHLRANLPNPEK